MDMFKQWVVGLVVFVAADAVWLGVVANGFYRNEMGPLLRMHEGNMNPRLAPAVLLYALVVFGLMVFALPKAPAGSALAAFGWCALFGLIGYGVYDLTNYAVLEGFSLRVATVDMVWGAVVCGLTGTAMYLVRG
jgi:uncharacterized membrane protein